MSITELLADLEERGVDRIQTDGKNIYLYFREHVEVPMDLRRELGRLKPTLLPILRTSAQYDSKPSGYRSVLIV